MEPEIQPLPPEVQVGETAAIAPTPEPNPISPDPWETRAMRWVFLGSEGLRCGWSAVGFFVLFLVLVGFFGAVFFKLHLIGLKTDFNVFTALFGELISFLALVGAASVAALVERRGSLLAFNLRGPRGISHFLSGAVAGFAALSALVGTMAWGGWLKFGPTSLSSAEILKFAALWGAAFLLVGCVEEGQFRCYLLFTLTRGINFWWALGTVSVVTALVLAIPRGNGVAGVCAMALLGLGPCLLLHMRKAESARFWQAAWVTSTLFGAIHTSNKGEGWIGIFAAAAVGFVFCVSIRVTGSAWWAIGCHASWDWAQTFFYGTADSGLQPKGHYLTSTPAGNALWSGGASGPEGSLLVLGAILLLLLVLLVIYGRKKAAALPAPVAEQAAG
jgi:membrane protease YdiL (CAAX protease family)